MRPNSSSRHNVINNNTVNISSFKEPNAAHHARRRAHPGRPSPDRSTAVSLFDEPSSAQPEHSSQDSAAFNNRPAPKPEKPIDYVNPPNNYAQTQEASSDSGLRYSSSVPDWTSITSQFTSINLTSRLSALPQIAFREFAQPQSSATANSSQDDLSAFGESGLTVYTVQQIAPLNADEMPCRERTAEFRTTAKSLQMKQHAMAQMNGVKPTNKHIHQSVQFNQIAKRIGRDLSQTCAKLEKMAELTKRRSIFDENVNEMEQLTNIIKQDITGLNNQITKLHEFSAHARNATTSKQNTNHSQSVVVGLQSRLATVSNEFKSILETRTENMKEQRTRRDKFGQSSIVPSSLPPSASTGNMGSVLLMDEAQASSSAGGYYANGAVALDMDVVNRTRAQQQLLLQDESQSYLNQRADAMQNIESHIVELGQIFRQLASLVSEQGETIQRIDSNVEDVSLNVEAAHMELLKYFRGISNNRWLALKVFGILIVFFFVFIVFLT